ncbi:uncharacterized protein LOC128952289 [Oppia nitens]|uniref:uncharacterized protein LOC128952289 n=1 Tax=Oppia nitens TaxID=1686743 RepID=UPI0023DB0AEC|nr:uncharacterized protein LOC128952289 [Oppia nitens]
MFVQSLCRSLDVLSRRLSGLSVATQSIRYKRMIKWCGYLDRPEFKKRDIRWQIGNKHKPKLISWQDYQFRKFRAEYYTNSPFAVWQSKMDMAENMVRTGMSTKSVSRVLDLHPHCVEYLQKKLNGTVELVREAHYSLHVNDHPGQY